MLPPKDIDPALLFRRCLELPRPSVAIGSPFDGCPLRVQAVGSFELGAGTREDLISAAVILEDGSRAFTKRQLGGLYPHELDRLEGETWEALQGFPCYRLSELEPWRRTLALGSQDASNAVLAHALRSCFDMSPAGTLIDRPDRFFGVPLNQLIDCHWLAFWAANQAQDNS